MTRTSQEQVIKGTRRALSDVHPKVKRERTLLNIEVLLSVPFRKGRPFSHRERPWQGCPSPPSARAAAGSEL